MSRFKTITSLGVLCIAVALMLACIPEFENGLPGPKVEDTDCELLNSWSV